MDTRKKNGGIKLREAIKKWDMDTTHKGHFESASKNQHVKSNEPNNARLRLPSILPPLPLLKR